MYRVHFTSGEIRLIRQCAKDATIGGHVVYGDRSSGKIDQYVGQAGEAALSKFLTGSVDLYLRTRLERNKNKLSGDGGSDLLGLNVDIKTSRMRAGLSHDYWLTVYPSEWHAGIVYWLGLMWKDDDEVYLAGYCPAEELDYGPNWWDGKMMVYAKRSSRLYPPLGYVVIENNRQGER